jgi:murein DD-endopeptidase MepM/ murein hydrolase activator NlpD
MRRLLRVLTFQAVSLTLTAVTAAPQALSPTARRGVPFASRPRIPRQGSLIELRVTPPPQDGDSVVAVLGELAGEPLHFERRPAGGFRALGGVPLDAPDTITVRLELHRATGVVDPAEIRLPVARRPALVDRIATAQEFADEPDSALAARIAEEREVARAVAFGAHDVPRLWVKPFVRPRPRTSRVTSPFGVRREMNGILGGRHLGVDVAAPSGALVRAANRGVVALVGDLFYGGISVYVYHGAGLMTAYHHLSRAAVAVGDTVECGEVIGRVGATGRVTGPHLHWAAQYGRLSIDPADLLTLLAGRPD